MEKLRVISRVYINKQGMPTESYILADNKQGYFRVTIDDAVKLAQGGYIDAKAIAHKNYIEASNKLDKVAFNDAINIKYIGEQALKALLDARKSQENILHIDTTKKNKVGIIELSLAVVSKQTNKIIGYIYEDGVVAKVNEIPTNHKRQLTQSLSLQPKTAIKQPDLLNKLSRDIDLFNKAYQGLFDIKTTRFKGVDTYMRIPINVNYLDIKHAIAMKNYGDIKDFIIVDDIDKLIYDSMNITPFIVAELLGYRDQNVIADKGNCYICNYNLTFKGVIAEDIKPEQFIEKMHEIKLNAGILLGKNNAIIYNTADKKIRTLPKHQLYKVLLTQEVKELEKSGYKMGKGDK